MKLPSIFRGQRKVLLVEDDVALRTALADKCKESGFKVLEAGAADEVLSILGLEKPDVLVLDLILPMKDGITLLEELRMAGFQMPVLILSNLLGSHDLRADAERLNAAFYNKSSVSLEEIVEVLEQSLS